MANVISPEIASFRGTRLKEDRKSKNALVYIEIEARLFL